MARRKISFDAQVANPGIVANPVSTFVQAPQPAQSSPLDNLVQSLSRIQPSLARFANDENRRSEEGRTERRKRAFTEGEALALETDIALTERDLISKGVIQPNQGRWFMKGFREQRGRLLGRQFADQLSDAATGFDRDNGDVRSFLAENRTKFMDGLGQQDADVLAGLLPKIREVETNTFKALDAAQSNRVIEVKKGMVIDELDDTLKEVIPPTWAAMTDADRAVSLTNLSALVSIMRDRERATGLQGAEFNETLVTVVTQFAIDNDNLEILEILEQDGVDVITGRKVPGAGRTQSGVKAIALARRTIERNREQTSDREWQQQQRTVTLSRQIATQDISRRLSEDPNWTPDETFFSRWEQRGAFDVRGTYYTARNARAGSLDAVQEPSHAAAVEYLVRIRDWDERNILDAAMGNDGAVHPVFGVLKLNWETARRLMAVASQRDQQAADLASSRRITEFIGSTSRIIGGDFPTTETRRKAAEATRIIFEEVARFNKNGSDETDAVAVNKMVEMAQARIENELGVRLSPVQQGSAEAQAQRLSAAMEKFKGTKVLVPGATVEANRQRAIDYFKKTGIPVTKENMTEFFWLQTQLLKQGNK